LKPFHFPWQVIKKGRNPQWLQRAITITAKFSLTLNPLSTFLFMKTFFAAILLSFFVLPSMAQSKTSKTDTPNPNKEILTVDAACGECRLGLPGESCDLAVRINGKSYFVDGTHIDSHGDPHAKDGFCEAVRKAEVQGEIVGDRFKVTYFKLLPVPKNKK
jgi:hypothetical protein